MTDNANDTTCEVECFDDGVDEGLDGEWFSYSNANEVIYVLAGVASGLYVLGFAIVMALV